MSCIKNNSIVNNIMFAPPYPSYSSNLGVCWIKEVCCLFVQYHTVAGPLILTSDDDLEAHPIIIICHGNACDIGQMVDFTMELCASCKSHVLLYEYPGYGLSGGVPTEESCTQGIINIINHLNQKMNIPITNMIFWGQSIGSGIATVGYKYCKTNLKQSPTGLILISPYLSITALKNDVANPWIPILERFNTKDNIKYCDTGLLIIHGKKDTLISVTHSIKLNEIVKCPVKILDIIDDATHNNIPLERIISCCKSLFVSISHLLTYDVIYKNDLDWVSKYYEEPQSRPTYTKLIATSMEASAATSVNAYEYLCTIF
jgi:hypothetical protein